MVYVTTEKYLSRASFPYFEVIVGRYEFPQSFPCSITDFLNKPGIWVGVSVLSYKTYRGSVMVRLWKQRARKDVIGCGTVEKGLFASGNYWIINHVELLAMDPQESTKYDLRKYGAEIKNS